MRLQDFIQIIPPPRKSAIRDWTAKVGNLETTGDDANAAVNTLKAAIEQAFDGDYCPYILPFRGYLAIAWRTPRDWSYKILDQDDLTKCEGTFTRLWGCSSYTKQELHGCIRYHLAEMAWDGQEESSPLLEDAEDHDRFGRWARWQKRYKALKDTTDMDDTAIRYQILREGY